MCLFVPVVLSDPFRFLVFFSGFLKSHSTSSTIAFLMRSQASPARKRKLRLLWPRFAPERSDLAWIA